MHVHAQTLPVVRSTTDSTFVRLAHPVIFDVSKTELRPEEKRWIADTLRSMLSQIGPDAVVLGRSAASPEGPWDFNVRLSRGRRNAVVDYLRELGVDASHIRFDVVTEDYPMLLTYMQMHNDTDYTRVRELVHSYGTRYAELKDTLRRVDDGTLWDRLLRQYYPDLRAVRIMAYNPLPDITLGIDSLIARSQKSQTYSPFTVPETETFPLLEMTVKPFRPYRREMLSVKTNLLEWGAYVPQYGFCPMPNVAVEFYPRRGHFTVGASFDCPWWIGNTENHKYFEVRNYQLEGRYYFRPGKQPGKAAFSGWYVSIYGHGGLYQIGFSDTKGWVGEGGGAGIGGGYVLPLTKWRQHWRLEFNLQAGWFMTRYDPFVYGCPVDGIDDGRYYYNYLGDADTFRKRRHLFNWIGPTRIGISLTYDLLYWKRK